MNILAVIPARYASTRFPGKPLALLGGKPMVQWVYERARGAPGLSEVIVATDDERIAAAVASFGGRFQMTSPDHPSGTDRVAEVARHFPSAEVVINIQGDEPFVRVEQLAALAAAFHESEVQIATLRRPIQREDDLFNPNVVKVVTDQRGRALLFSRECIPHLRGQAREEWLAAGAHYQHLGLYAYRREVLSRLTELPLGQLEQWEALEQLRWLEAGYHIYVGTTDTASLGIDTREDLERAERWLKQQNL